MIVTTEDLFKLAYGNYALGAYNINKYMQLRGRYNRLHELQKQLKK